MLKLMDLLIAFFGLLSVLILIEASPYLSRALPDTEQHSEYHFELQTGVDQ